MYSDYKRVCKVIKEDLVLSDYTTFGIGGKAKLVLFPSRVDELVDILNLALKLGDKPYILGAGSNLLVSDKNYGGVVICARKLDETKLEKNIIFASAGAKLPTLCHLASSRNLSGLEFCSGIPATLGGAIKMNAGAFGLSIGSVVESVNLWRDGNIYTYKPNFSYRKSDLSGGVVLGAKLKLEFGDREQIKEKIKLFREIRSQKQPKAKSAGSIFLSVDGVSAGYYIDNAGLKGFRVGGAEVSSVHAGFIINRGNATASDVLSLICEIKERVYDKFGVKLQTEIEFLGEFDETLR